MLCLNLFLAMKNYSFLKYDWWAESFTVTVTSFSTVSSFVLFPHWSWALLLWMSFNWRWWACDLFVIIGGIRRLYRCGIISAERLVHQHVKWFFVCLHWVMCLEDFTCNHQMSYMFGLNTFPLFRARWNCVQPSEKPLLCLLDLI